VECGSTGTRSRDHLVPFQRSAKVRFEVLPTAMHETPDEHETLLRLPWKYLDVGVRCTNHFLPFQCSVSVPALVEVGPK
jgi:hypothetical protein